MTDIWIHTNGSEYWEGPAVCASLDSVPRIGETVYLSEETLTALLERTEDAGEARLVGTRLSFRDNLTVLDVCHVEGEDAAHVMVDLPYAREPQV